MEQSKRVPYGVSNFVDIIERNQYYVDKTMYLPLLEKEADALFFIRPRRFGKSLLISMMRAYYDISMTERFQELFGNLWIGSHPTPQQGKYQVLYLDFSKIGGGIKLLEDRFNDYCGQCVDFFVDTLYKDYYTPEAIAKIKGINYASGKLNALAMEAQKNGYQLFLIVDEYDNYCFSEEALRTQSKVFNCDMVLYYLRNYMETGEAPRQMIDPNTKTDYNKMKKLLQLDKLDGDRKGVILTIAEKGEIVGNIEESFPAKALTNPEIFISLLFYYGMLTIKDTFGDQLILGIPNNNVRKQYYNYLLEQYQEEKYINTSNLKTMFTYMAFEGKWKECLEYMAKAYAEVSSVRDGIEAERNLQGFFMAYFSLNNYYYTAPELELNQGYCDFFLLPNLTHYPTKHSYIIELKVLSKKDSDTLTEDGKMTKGAKQWLDAEEQIKRYAKAPRVEALRQGTTLHKIIMQFKGWELARIDEVNEI